LILIGKIIGTRNGKIEETGNLGKKKKKKKKMVGNLAKIFHKR
jgi:hypothetical protein